MNAVLLFYFIISVTIVNGWEWGKAKSTTNRFDTTTSTSTTTKEPQTFDRHRIIGGIETRRNEYPFLVSLSRDQHFCGGSIIDKSWVVTAAHCAIRPDFDITAGEHDLRNPEGTEQKVKAVKVIRHPNYNPLTYEDDISLVKVDPPFQYTSFVQSFNLPSVHFVANGNVTTAGWGVTEEGSNLVSPVLRKVTIGIIPNMECAKQYGKEFFSHKMICAGQVEGGKDACQGDSGGPLLCNDYQGGATLCGIVSFGFGCARRDFSGVYTKVAYYADWIDWEKAKDVDPSSKWSTYPPLMINSTVSITTFSPLPTQKRSTRRPWRETRKKNGATNVQINNRRTWLILSAILILIKQFV